MRLLLFLLVRIKLKFACLFKYEYLFRICWDIGYWDLFFGRDYIWDLRYVCEENMYDFYF